MHCRSQRLKRDLQKISQEAEHQSLGDFLAPRGCGKCKPWLLMVKVSNLKKTGLLDNYGEQKLVDHINNLPEGLWLELWFFDVNFGGDIGAQASSVPRHFCEHWTAHRQEEVWSVCVGRPEIPHLVRIDESPAGNCLLDQKSAPGLKVGGCERLQYYDNLYLWICALLHNYCATWQASILNITHWYY